MSSIWKKIRSGLQVALLSVPAVSQAYVECGVTVNRYFVGDGILWAVWNEGGAGTISQTQTDFKPVLASIMTALAGNRRLTIRYADGSSCGAQPVPIVGIWLH